MSPGKDRKRSTTPQKGKSGKKEDRQRRKARPIELEGDAPDQLEGPKNSDPNNLQGGRRPQRHRDHQVGRRRDAVESRPASRIPKKAVWHIHINRVINPRVAERCPVDIPLDEIGEEIERPRIPRGESKLEDDRTEMVVPTRMEFVINDTPPLNIELLADTGSEMEVLAGRGLFSPHLLEDAMKTGRSHRGRE